MAVDHCSRDGEELFEMKRGLGSISKKSLNLSGDLNVVFDALGLPKNFVAVVEKNGKYFVRGKELRTDHPEEWSSVIIAEMAKNYLK
jgi:hypothetical protein